MPNQSDKSTDPDVWDQGRLNSEVAFCVSSAGRLRREDREIAFALEIDRLTTRNEELKEALQRIVEWSRAYPLSVFPEPTQEYYDKAHKVLTENGMTIDRISAAAMRHAIEGVGKIAREAIG